MDSINVECKNAGFVFIWTIKNYRFRDANGLKLDSPELVINENNNEKWRFVMIPTQTDEQYTFEFFLEKISPECREMTLELEISSNNRMFKQVQEKKIFMADDFTYLEVFHISKVLRRLSSSKNDSLTLKCRIWKVDNKVLSSRQCYIQTFTDVEKINFPCSVGDISQIRRIRENFIKWQIILSEVPFFNMNLSWMIRTLPDYYISKGFRITLKQIGPFKKCFCNCVISLIDAYGRKHPFVESRFVFENSNEPWTLVFALDDVLDSNKEQNLSNRILSWHCEFGVSSDATNNKVEEKKVTTAKRQKLHYLNPTTESNSSGSLKDNLQQFYSEGKFSDLTIQTPNKKLYVHKTILCARSKVFSAMFEHDTKENQTGVIEIGDIDEDAISKMLLFLYTDKVEENLEFGMASSLYFAADKYRIVALKRKCSDFMKGNFTVTNICDALVLADMHQDQELKSAAVQFVFEHSGEIMKSEGWKKLMQNQVQLAAETMQSFIKNLT